ncbi:uncharacterized protein F5147DRAFT_64676 [Suillus discolor]|uniref:F-box domain-containing protein n=1 Tax=Suillus discolor TaxID=1912936 RepID=A0A9P7FDM9_9AGAM|nr:uncharacterized protein F5147DRAFT_64676 [Suillus discolor]KAG2113174.1 hypothetical protein F5147DRAFT_64676 [Suillus discolor]
MGRSILSTPLVYYLPDSRSGWDHKDRTDALTTRDWEVMQKYVPRIRSLRFHVAAGRGPRCCNILKALRQSPVAQPPLPNLQRLDYRCYVFKDHHLLDIFFVPSLIDLTIEVHPASFPDVSFISPLAALCPHLTSFRLSGYRSHEPIMATVSNVVMSLPHLRTLHCDQFSQAAITSRAIALLVSLVFPKVKKIVWGGWRKFGHLDKVNEHPEVFRSFP